MKPSRRGPLRIHAGIGTALVATLLAVVPVSASADPSADPSAGPGTDPALQAAQQLFEPRGQVAAQGEPGGRRTPAEQGGPVHATAVLRDLAVRLDRLSAEDRRTARALLARPTDPRHDGYPPVTYGRTKSQSTCEGPDSTTLHVCVNWVSTGDHAATEAWVEQTQEVLEEVWERVVGELGYAPPPGDEVADEHGVDGRLDVYLADLSPWWMYGFCTLEDGPGPTAYCVLDNDFEDFLAPPEESLRVTAAHEFFHAVQFGYNPYVDHWLMEGTATWVEDEVYDGIDDNLQYLASSALSAPGRPLDTVDPRDPNSVYGSWIWWRFLTEYFGSRSQADPSVVRDVWKRLAVDGPSSMRAMRRVVARRGAAFPEVFADFAVANRVAGRWYEEGRSYLRHVGEPAWRIRLTRDRRGSRWKGVRLDHLSTGPVVVRPGDGLGGRRWRLRVDLDLPRRFRGSRARLLVDRGDDRTRWRDVQLDRRGDGRIFAPFDRREVRRVMLSLVNTSTRIRDCDGDTTWSCGGTPVDDGLPFWFRTRVVRAAAPAR